MNLKALIKKSKLAANKRLAKNFNNIETVLIVWDATQAKSEIEEIKTFGHELRQSGKQITFLTYHPIKKLSPAMQPNELYRLCSNADFTIFKAPKSIDLKNLLNTSFDLFINGCLKENKILKTFSAYTQSHFRIGPYIDSTDTDFYELMILPNGADPCENYLIEIGKYLKKIH